MPVTPQLSFEFAGLGFFVGVGTQHVTVELTVTVVVVDLNAVEVIILTVVAFRVYNIV